MSTRNDNLLALLASSAIVFVGVILASVSRLAERVVIARMFDPAVYGEVTIGLSIMAIGSTLALVGLNHGMPRYVSRYEDDRDVRGVWLVGFAFSLATSLLVVMILLLNIDLLTHYFYDDAVSTDLLRLFILIIPLNVGVTIGIGFLRGMENTKYKFYAEDLIHPGLRLLLLVGILAAGFSILAVGYAYAVAAVVGLLVVHYFANRLVPLVGPVRTHSRELVAYSAPLILAMFLTVLLTQMDTLMVGFFRSSTEVGLYNAAYPLASSLLLFVSAFGYLYLPIISRLDAEGLRHEISAIYSVTTKWGFVATFPAFLAVLVFADDILTMFFSAEYAPAGIALAILSLGFFTSATMGHNRTTLAALGYTTHMLFADIITLAVNLVLNVVLIPIYGFAGAAVATSGAYVARNVVVYLVLRIKFGITPFSRVTTTTYVLIPLVLAPVGYVLSTLVTFSAPVLVAFVVAIGLAELVIITVAGCLQPEDAVFVEFVEKTIGKELTFVRNHLPVAIEE
ncbi:flippase [Haladaptatus sp. DYSN1]|uniref:flippase n=1 Tax=unclassified Haladaptatus TaxID=2622732 RepID=UPI00240532AE|nr:flippase [Haladaptatus sp. DYSN1]